MRHGKNTVADEVERTSEALGSGVTSGLIKGAKKGLGFGRKGVEK
jgi:hypothetical protein